jgi:hypothetical protein
MLRSILHIALAALVLLNGLGYSLIQADFLLNREEIAVLFCINKEKPELACEGKCELERRLGEAQDHEEQKQQLTQEEVQIYVLPSYCTAPPVIWKEIHPVYGVWDDDENELMEAFDFFHPPTQS